MVSRNGKTTQDEYLVIPQHLIPSITRVLGILMPHPNSMIMARKFKYMYNVCVCGVY